MIRLRAPHVAIVLAIALTAAAGCAPGPTRPPAEPEAEAPEAEVERAERLSEEGRPLEAVRIYRDLAEQTDDPARAQRWRLRIVELLFAEGYPGLALEWQSVLDARPVPAELARRRAVVDARAALERDQGERALRLLPPATPELADALRARILDVRASALAMTGQPVAALRLRLERDPLLESADDRLSNHEAIWSLLDGMPVATLERVADAEGPPAQRGWAELGRAIARARLGEQKVAAAISDWRRRFPDHPATERFLDTLGERVLEQMSYPERIAVLLPLSGQLADPARAVRDGLLAGYYQHPDNDRRPALEIYDTGDGGADAEAAYRRAVDDGATFVIGPLAKEAVTALARRERLPVPVLSLNYLPADAGEPPAGLHQFGLLPEDEARQAAEAAIANEHRNALALVPAGHWGARLLGAFESRYAELGGRLLESSAYNSRATDYARPIQALLNLDDSQARRRRVQSTIGRPVELEPRRRRDVEVIFLAARPRQARLLEPQLEFHRAGDVPAYATSHVFSGTPDPSADWDLNGLSFTETPWILDNLGTLEPLYRTIRDAWPGLAEQVPRLYALGIDAFSVVPHLERLDANAAGAYSGRTGRITLDDRNRLHRQLRWATFIDGRPEPIRYPGASPGADAILGGDVIERAGEP